MYRTVIAYGEHERMVGDAAVAQMRGNFKNTIPFVNRFIGLTSECKEQVEEETKFISNKTGFAEDKKLTFKVMNKGENIELVPEQLYAAFLKKLKKMFSHEDEKADVVLAVPPYFSSIERQAVLDACKIAKVNCLRLMNENTAIALCYGFFRRKEFSSKAKNIAFLDMGHGNTTCTVASFTDKKVTILSHVSNRNLGARNFDLLLLDIIGGEFNNKYGCDPRKAPKARLRMLDQIEKMRKILSANSEATLSIECLLEDEDLYQTFTREKLEELIQPNVEELRVLLEQALAESKLKTKDIDCVELVGEGTRTPAVKNLAEEVFKKDKHQRTINSSEAVARGCSLMAAMVLPQYHVANFEIQEYNQLPINVSWSVSDGKMKSQTLFPKGNNFPSVKSLTFDGRSEPMDVGISYKNLDGIVAGLPQLLARYRVEPPKPKEAKFSLKLRVQLDQNSIPSLDTAEQIEEYMEIKKIPIKSDKPAPKKEDKKEGEGEGDKKEEVKEPEIQYEEKEVKKTRSTQIHFKFEHHGYGAKHIEEFIAVEDGMSKQDNVILEVKVMRNHLETYVYDMRAALDTVGDYKPFMKDNEREVFLSALNDAESWLYDEGESAAKDIYQQKLDSLSNVGEPVKMRYKFHDVYPSRLQDFENFVNEVFSNAANIPDDSHITTEEKEELSKACEENANWISNIKQIQESLPKYEDPSFNLSEFDERRSSLSQLGDKILNKPVPKKEEPKKEDEAKPEEGKEGSDKEGAAEPPKEEDGDKKE